MENEKRPRSPLSESRRRRQPSEDGIRRRRARQRQQRASETVEERDICCCRRRQRDRDRREALSETAEEREVRRSRRRQRDRVRREGLCMSTQLREERLQQLSDNQARSSDCTGERHANSRIDKSQGMLNHRSTDTTVSLSICSPEDRKILRVVGISSSFKMQHLFGGVSSLC